MVWRTQNSYNLLSGGCNRPNRSCCPDGVWIPQRWPSRCFPRRQGRLFWEGHSGADKSNPTHLHCLPHRHGWDDWNGSNVGGLSLYHTLKNRLVQYHEPTREPSDAEAVLEWGLDTPFTSQDKPPLAVAMVVTLNGVRSLKRYRLVIAQKSKLRLTQEVTAALASHSREHRLTASGFFPCSIDREYLYGYAGDGYRSPLWLCVSYNGSPVLVHRLRGNKIHFHQAIKERRILIIPGIHYFDAHRLQPQLLQAPALQIHLRASHLAGPEGAGEAVEDPSSDEERATTDGESEVEAAAEDADLPPEEPMVPTNPGRTWWSHGNGNRRWCWQAGNHDE